MFYTGIDDVYRLEVGEKNVVTRDRPEGTKEHAGAVTLAKGIHPIKLTYLAGNPLAFNFNVEWEGPGIPRSPIPHGVLKCVDDDSFPTLSMDTQSFGDGSGQIKAVVKANGHEINNVKIFLDEFQIVEGNSDEVTYTGPLPNGASDLWVQVQYDKDKSVDLDGESLTIAGKPISNEWLVQDMGQQRLDGRTVADGQQ